MVWENSSNSPLFLTKILSLYALSAFFQTHSAINDYQRPGSALGEEAGEMFLKVVGVLFSELLAGMRTRILIFFTSLSPHFQTVSKNILLHNKCEKGAII